MEVRKDGHGSYLRMSESKVLLSGFPEHKRVGVKKSATLSDPVKNGVIRNLWMV